MLTVFRVITSIYIVLGAHPRTPWLADCFRVRKSPRKTGEALIGVRGGGGEEGARRTCEPWFVSLVPHLPQGMIISNVCILYSVWDKV